MTELARTPPRLQRLFQTVDLAPLPQHQTIAESLDLWRDRRGSDLAPLATDIFGDETHPVLDHSFLVEPLPETRDFSIGEVGSAARLLLDLKYPAETAMKLGARRIAVRLRPLFDLVVDRGEPIIVKFVEGRKGFELLGAPVSTPGGGVAMFCTLTFDELPA
jgi:hypothetical protein